MGDEYKVDQSFIRDTSSDVKLIIITIILTVHTYMNKDNGDNYV